MKAAPFVLGAAERSCVGAAARQVCRGRRWDLHAINVRTSHVHAVISAAEPPEAVMHALKAAASGQLRREGLIAPGQKVWARHGSTRYVREYGLEAVCAYVMQFQDHEARARLER